MPLGAIIIPPRRVVLFKEGPVHPKEAADIAQTIADSLKSDPHQFSISVRVIGQQITSHGGTGLSITATGGGPGSKTIGQSISMDGGRVEVLRGNAEQAMKDQIAALARSIEAIAIELRLDAPDKSKIKQVLDSLTGTWVPGLIIGVLSNAVSAAVGI
jgi:hypothetical protein